MNLQKSGYLEIFIGPMFASKTSKLIELYKQYTFCNIKTCVINHSFDKRYSTTDLVSHDGVKIPCIMSDNLLHLEVDADVILINEAQFFTDIVEGVKKMLEMKKMIYIGGLDGDYQRNKIGNVLDLIPLCDQVTKLHSLCGICKNGNKAIFSKRVTQETDQILIGSHNYIPVCRSCY